MEISTQTSKAQFNEFKEFLFALKINCFNKEYFPKLNKTCLIENKAILQYPRNSDIKCFLFPFFLHFCLNVGGENAVMQT